MIFADTLSLWWLVCPKRARMFPEVDSVARV
jgi:hypothetical protein